jgi:hypothetical protein
MSKKIYKTAMGKTVDLGSLILQNEQVRAVGNMGVNARGDVLDSADQVIDKKTSQVQRQYNRQTVTNVQDRPLHTSTREAKAAQGPKLQQVVETVLLDQPPESTVADQSPASGLAAALAKAAKTS